MRRNFWITFFISFSFLVLLFGGYNCAQEVASPSNIVLGPVVDTRPGVRPIAGIDEPPDEIYKDTSPSHRGQTGRKRKPAAGCHGDRGFIGLKDSYGGGLAPISFDQANMRDYRLGRENNYNIECARILVNLKKSGDGYIGRLIIAYRDPASGNNNVIKKQSYHTGYSSEDVKYNEWKGSWAKPPDNNQTVEPKFIAIFEDKNFGALIMHIKEVERINQEGGENIYKAYGEIWFKAFRTYTRKSDTCYSQGVYVSKARRQPPLSPKRCWQNNVGPYSCLPSGINTIKKLEDQLDPRNEDLDLDCYQLLGKFINLDISEAFNVSTESEIKRLN